MVDLIRTDQLPATADTEGWMGTGPIRIRPTPSAPAPKADPYAGFSTTPTSDAKGNGGAIDIPAAPVNATEAPVQPDQNNPYAAYSPVPPEKQSETRTVSGGEAASRGVLDAAFFGFAPAIAGLAEASGIPSSVKSEDAIDLNPARPIVGAYKMLSDYLSSHPDQTVQDAYNRGRQAMLENQKLAEEQHPAAFLLGQLGGALVTLPVGGEFGAGAKAAETAGVGSRILGATKTGGIGGALYGAGESTSQGNDATDIAADAVKGGATGAAFGSATGAALEGGRALISKGAQIYRGRQNPALEGARQTAEALRSDITKYGNRFTPEELSVANEASVPLSIADFGHQRTRRLARKSANVSPEADQALRETAQQRFENQSPRISSYIRSITGGAETSTDLFKLKEAARAKNKPLYARAYHAGRNGVWTSELERLSQSNIVKDAIASAQKKARDTAIADGFKAPTGAFTIKNGKVSLTKTPNGEIRPSIQLWDYVQREVTQAGEAAERAGLNSDARTIKNIAHQLKEELDKAVPEFGAARATAAKFFGAEDALEAGKKFVMMNSDIADARRALSKMSKPERELFARGFASELADIIYRSQDNRNVLNSAFLNSPAARQKIEMALGPDRARKLEVLLRVENLVDELRKGLGNSTTARQLHDMGHGGGPETALIIEGAEKAGGLVAAGILLGRNLLANAKKKIDGNVATHVGELLASSKPENLSKGVRIVSNSPSLLDALRRATGAASLVGAHNIGPERAAAGAGAALSELVDEGEEHSHHRREFEDQPLQ